MSSYLSSFGHSSSPSDADHEIFKRSPKPRKMRKGAKKTAPATTQASIDDEENIEIITGKPNAEVAHEPRNTYAQTRERKEVIPGEMFKFEIDDAAYSEEYEKFRQSKNRRLRSARSHHLRVKRSSDDKEDKSDVKIESSKQAKETFVQPKEFLRFLISDAVTNAPETTSKDDKKESSEKKKRETADQATADTIKNVQLNNPLRDRHVIKHVAYEEMSPKLKSMIDSALIDAIQRKAASENDYLKFFYGDKIIKVPMSLSKHIKLNVKETPSKVETQTKTPFYPTKSPKYKYEKPIYHTTQPTSLGSSGKAESYANFKTPIIVGKPIVSEVKIPEVVTETPTLIDPSYKKSVYFYSSGDEDLSKSSPATASPGPVLFTTPSSIDTPLSLGHYKTRVIHPTHTEVKFLKDSIPINEQIDESYSGYSPPVLPLVLQHHSSHPIVEPIHNHQSHQIHHPSSPPAPISPIIPHSTHEYMGNYDGHYDKNYEFGYVIEKNPNSNPNNPANKTKKKRKKLKKKLR